MARLSGGPPQANPVVVGRIAAIELCASLEAVIQFQRLQGRVAPSGATRSADVKGWRSARSASLLQRARKSDQGDGLGECLSPFWVPCRVLAQWPRAVFVRHRIDRVTPAARVQRRRKAELSEIRRVIAAATSRCSRAGRAGRSRPGPPRRESDSRPHELGGGPDPRPRTPSRERNWTPSSCDVLCALRRVLVLQRR
jgi:ribosome modulation factor